MGLRNLRSPFSRHLINCRELQYTMSYYGLVNTHCKKSGHFSVSDLFGLEPLDGA